MSRVDILGKWLRVLEAAADPDVSRGELGAFIYILDARGIGEGDQLGVERAHATIAEASGGQTRRSAIRSTEGLVEKRYLDVRKGKGRTSNSYCIRVSSDAAVAPEACQCDAWKAIRRVRRSANGDVDVTTTTPADGELEAASSDVGVTTNTPPSAQPENASGDVDSTTTLRSGDTHVTCDVTPTSHDSTSSPLEAHPLKQESLASLGARTHAPAREADLFPRDDDERQKPAPRNGSAKLTLETFSVDDDTIAWAASELPGVDPLAHVGHWRDHHLAKGAPIKDLRASYRNWLRAVPKYRALDAARNRGRPGEAMSRAAARVISSLGDDEASDV